MRFKPLADGICTCDYCKKEYLRYIPSTVIDVTVYNKHYESITVQMCRDCIKEVRIGSDTVCTELIPKIKVSEKTFQRIQNNKEVLIKNFLHEYLN